MPADDVLLAGAAESPALTKAMVFLVGGNCFDQTSPVLMASAMVFRTWSYLHLYSPSPSALVQQQRMCSRVPRSEHNGHADVSANNEHQFRAANLCSSGLRLAEHRCCNPSCVHHLYSLASFLPDLQNLIPPPHTFSGSASLK